MSQAVTRYHALHQSLVSRRTKPELPKGLDLIAGRTFMKFRHRRISLAFLRREAEATDALAPRVRSMSEGVLDVEIEKARETFVRGRQNDEAVRHAFSLVREVARRATGEEAFVVQLMGAMALYHGRIIEMLTGEGKTLTGSLAAPLIAWQRRYLHIFTVNDYLAARDAASRRPIYSRCLCDVGAITQEMDQADRFAVYARPILYGTPKQIVADWLRDQIRLARMTTAWTGRRLMSLMPKGMDESAGPMVPGLKACLVDEADAVLIDEGVVPLIIARSRREDDMADVYRKAAEIAEKLDEGPDFSIEHLKRRADLKRRGRHRLEQIFAALEQPIWKAQRRAEELVRQALVARHCYLHGKQYQIVDGKVMIVDEYTGRFLPDRQWEHGLHQSVEAKEGLDVTADRETLARQSFQRFYRSYPFLCGMTGTAADATIEMEKVYARPVTVIPTNRPIARKRWPLAVYRTQKAKWAAIVASIEELNALGRPQLVGTRSIAASEFLSRLLTEKGLEHKVLNALHDKEEADLIVGAGYGIDPHSGRGAAITVATNMAGRGTDIRLDDAARKAGGLHVILTEMHGAKRIDRQFIGRAGRQGDPGSAQIFVSLEDELIVRNAPLLAAMLRRGAKPEGGDAAALERLIANRPGWDKLQRSRLTETCFRIAQRRSETRDRRSRAGVLRQDDWIDKYLPGM
jgi:preprotein translocase subunit SecA